MRRVFLAVLLCAASVLAEPAPQLKEKGGYETWLHLSDDGAHVAVDHSVRVSVWNLERRKLLREMRGFIRVSCLEFSPDNKALVVGDYPRWLGCFDLGDPIKKRWEFRASWSGKGDPQMAGAYGVIFSPDSKYLLAIGSSHGAQIGDEMVRLLSAADGRVLRTYPKWGGRGNGEPRNFGFTPDKKAFVRGYQDKLELYGLPGGEKLREVGLQGKCFEVRADPRGIVCRLDVGSDVVKRMYSYDQLKVIEEVGGYEEFPQHPDGTLSWKRTGEQLTVSNSSGVVYTGTAGQRVAHWIRGGGFVIGAEDDPGKLYDVAGKVLNGKLKDYLTYSPYAAVAHSQAGYGGPMEIYDLWNGQPLVKLGFASDCETSANGRRMVAMLKDGLLLVDVAASLKQGKLVLWR